MKIEITKSEIKQESFQKGQLIESNKGGIYLCTSNQQGLLINIVVIEPDSEFEHSGKIIEEAYTYNFKVFNGSCTLSNN